MDTTVEIKLKLYADMQKRMERNTHPQMSIEISSVVVLLSSPFFVLSQYLLNSHVYGRKKFTVEQNKLTFQKACF